MFQLKQSLLSSRDRRRRRRQLGLTAAAAVLLLATGCSKYDRDDYVLTPDVVSNFLTISAPTTMPADGVTTTTIVVEVKDRSTASFGAVFVVTAGTIVGGSNDGKQATVPLDDSGRAAIQFRSDPDPKTVNLTVSVDKVTVSRQIRFEAVPSSALFSLSVNPLELPADGISRSVVQVKLQTIGTADQRAVTFKTSDGTLFGSGSSGPQVNETATGDGIAMVELQSGLTPGNAVITVTALGHSSTATIVFRPVSTTDIIQSFTIIPTAVDADGRSLARITVRVTPRLSGDRRSVRFRSTVGQFVGGSDSIDVTADAATNEARADLRSSEAGAALVSVSVGGVTQQGSVAFSTALPDHIVVSPQGATVPVGGSMRITAFLIRDPGRGSVTQGLIPQFTTVPASGPGGVFTELQRSNTEGTVGALLNMPSTAIPGPLVIRVSVADSAVIGTTTIQVVP